MSATEGSSDSADERYRKLEATQVRGLMLRLSISAFLGRGHQLLGRPLCRLEPSCCMRVAGVPRVDAAEALTDISVAKGRCRILRMGAINGLTFLPVRTSL